jgi:hypothetical protein
MILTGVHHLHMRVFTMISQIKQMRILHYLQDSHTKYYYKTEKSVSGQNFHSLLAKY